MGVWVTSLLRRERTHLCGSHYNPMGHCLQGGFGWTVPSTIPRHSSEHVSDCKACFACESPMFCQRPCLFTTAASPASCTHPSLRCVPCVPCAHLRETRLDLQCTWPLSGRCLLKKLRSRVADLRLCLPCLLYTNAFGCFMVATHSLVVHHQFGYSNSITA